MSVPASEKKAENPANSKSDNVLNKKPTKQEKLIILIDLDILLDTAEAFQLALWEQFGVSRKEFDFHQRKTFDYPPNCTYNLNGVSLEVNTFMRDTMVKRNFFRDAPEIPGAVAKVRELMAHPDCDVYFCTAPLHDIPSADPKIEWLVKRFGPDARTRTFVCTSTKMIVADVLLVDQPQDFEDTQLRVFYPQTWNAHISGATYMPVWTSLNVPRFVEVLKERLMQTDLVRVSSLLMRLTSLCHCEQLAHM